MGRLRQKRVQIRDKTQHTTDVFVMKMLCPTFLIIFHCYGSFVNFQADQLLHVVGERGGVVVEHRTHSESRGIEFDSHWRFRVVSFTY